LIAQALEVIHFVAIPKIFMLYISKHLDITAIIEIDATEISGLLSC
jgi:hypothetical protein